MSQANNVFGNPYLKLAQVKWKHLWLKNTVTMTLSRKRLRKS
jgi:hypothetical protein